MTDSNKPSSPPANSAVMLALAWLAVGIPLAWGVEQTIKKALALFS